MVISERFAVEKVRDVIFEDEQVDSDLEKWVFEQEDDMEENFALQPFR